MLTLSITALQGKADMAIRVLMSTLNPKRTFITIISPAVSVPSA